MRARRLSPAECLKAPQRDSCPPIYLVNLIRHRQASPPMQLADQGEPKRNRESQKIPRELTLGIFCYFSGFLFCLVLFYIVLFYAVLYYSVKLCFVYIAMDYSMILYYIISHYAM